MPRSRDVIIPGSIRVVHVEYEYTELDVRCGSCGHQQATTGRRTSTCKACGRTMRLEQAIEPGGNVVPIRRRA